MRRQIWRKQWQATATAAGASGVGASDKFIATAAATNAATDAATDASMKADASMGGRSPRGRDSTQRRGPPLGCELQRPQRLLPPARTAKFLADLKAPENDRVKHEHAALMDF